MFEVKKTIVRAIVTLPDKTARIQRLHDCGASFQLEEETITDAEEIANFISKLKAQGGREVKRWNTISDDDFLPRFHFLYEYID